MREKTMRPFSTGTEYAGWHSANCDKCKKYNEDINQTCIYEYEIGLACIDDGTISEKSANKIGLPSQFNCKLKEQTNE